MSSVLKETMSAFCLPEDFAHPLLLWYNEKKRDLPWRHTGDPYRIWVSEIMLQQTRVEAVRKYYLRFTEELPEISDLAACPDEKLLKLWEGLGYYSRVKNMKKAAQLSHDGLPKTYDSLRTLPGIGNYTAGAVASIAYGLPEPAVDGNVLRVLTRLTGCREDISKQKTRTDAEDCLRKYLCGHPEAAPGIFNQAMMELGALICLPNTDPLCVSCPVQKFCSALRDGTVSKIPVRAKKSSRRIEERCVLIIRDGNKTAIRKRPNHGLLAGLYEFPNIAGYKDADEAVQITQKMGFTVLRITPLPDTKHIFTHLEWRMRAYLIKTAQTEESLREDIILADAEELQKIYALPSAFDAYKEDVL